ncbi:hypothetical protein Tco_1510160 [Tanacetum coccineum]
MTTPIVTSTTDSQMHNNIMLATGRYAQWRSRFLRYIDTRPNGDALRKCILKGPYTPTIVTTPVVPATEDSLASEEDSDPEQAQKDKDMQKIWLSLQSTSRNSTNLPTTTSELP